MAGESGGPRERFHLHPAGVLASKTFVSNYHRGRTAPRKLSLVTITLTPRGIADLRETRDICKNILQSCICQDKDIILPPLTNTGGEESFFVVASTDPVGADILQRRISAKLDRSAELQEKCATRIRTTGIPLSDHQSLKPISETVEEVARTVTAFVMTALKLEATEPATNSPALYNHFQLPEKRGSNGKTEDTNPTFAVHTIFP